MEIAEKNNIKIFPQSWQDIKLNCSCPDWAVPCKHLAAVIYKIANEIDQNPFLVFNLHRFDIVNELSAHRLQLQELKVENIFFIRDCIETKKIKPKANDKKPETPDFSLIETLLTTLPLLFTANPLFYDGDFKTVVQNHYKRHARYEQDYLYGLKKEKPVLSNDYRYYDYRLVAFENGEFNFIARDSDDNIYEVKKRDLLILLAQTESKHLTNYQASFILLYRAFRFCNILAERGALLPRLFKAEKEKYRIQWIPALINASVKKVFNELLQLYPDNFIQISNPDADIKKQHSKTNPFLLPAKNEEALLLLCSFFCKYICAGMLQQCMAKR